MSKKTLILIFIVLGIIIPVFSSGKWNTVKAGFSQDSQIVKVGYFDYDGFIDQEPNGNFSGYGYDYLEEITNYTGWQYEFVKGSWEECLDRLEKGEIDLLCTAQYTSERAEKFDYSKYEIGVEYGALFVSKENHSVYYNDTASFNGLQIAFLKDSYQNRIFQEYAEENEFTYEAVYYSSAENMTLDLAMGRVDALVTGSLRRTYGEKVVAKFSPDPFYFITTKGNRAVMSGIDKAMEEIRSQDVNFSGKLFEKHYGESISSQLAFTREEAEYIEKNPALKAVYNDSFQPVEYQDGKRRVFSGIHADLMALIEEKSGLHFEYVPVKNYEEGIRMLEQGEADIGCGYNKEVNQKSRQFGVLFSKDYVEIPLALAARNGTDPDRIKKVVVPDYCRGLEQTKEIYLNNAEILFYPQLEDCLRAVKAGKADAVLENIYILDRYLKDGYYNGIEIVLSSQYPMPFSMAVSNDQDLVLLSILNKVISQIGTEEVHKIIVNNTISGNKMEFSLVVRRYGVPILIVILLLTLLAVIKSKKSIEKYAYEDKLTKCRNLTKFNIDGERILQAKKNGSYAIVSLDIDKFKTINDMYGYETGNQLLEQLAECLTQSLDSDEIVCRASGDNFVILVKNDAESSLRERMKEIMEKIRMQSCLAGRSLQYTLSCGIYSVEENVSVNGAIDRANLARKSVKGGYKNSIGFYNEAMRVKVLKEKEIESIMEEALGNGEFVVYYQPKYLIEDQKIIGAEALVRWIRPDGTMIFPDEFIPVFESNGFILQMDIYIFNQVCMKIREWMDQGKSPYPISVNLSRVHLFQTDFYKEYIAMIKHYRIPPNLLEIELTENVIFDNQLQLVTIMREFKKAGLSLSMDDFGSGFSSLNLLKDMPIDFLKLDREFFNVASDTDRGQTVIRNVVTMAKQLKILVISEGVETKEQVEFLKQIDCDIAQGYYFSKPVAVDLYEKMAFEATEQ